MSVRLAGSVLFLTTIAACGGRVGPGDPGSGDGGGNTGGAATGTGSGATGATTAGGSGGSVGTTGGGFGGSTSSGVGGSTSTTGGGVGGSGGAGGRGGGSGATGGGGSGGAGGGSPPPPGGGGACWSRQLREVQPQQPVFSVAEACMHAANDASWSAGNVSSLDAGISDPRNDDGRAFLVGRWVSCNPTTGAEGIEFGANGRWRLLTRDSAGMYLPASTNVPTTRGFYVLLGGTAQLNLRDDTGADRLRDGGTGSFRIAFVEALRAQEAMRWTRDASGPPFPPGPYARALPSPLNGWDNPPSLTSGTCSLVGTWDTVSVPTLSSNPSVGPQQPMMASFSFDDAGNFVAAPGVRVDLCTTHPMYGTYDLSLGIFQLTTNVGMGLCSFWFDAAYSVNFSADCTRMSTTINRWDNCTGGRGYFNSPTTLVKRQ